MKRKLPIFSKLYEDRNVLTELTRRNIKSQYRESVLGLVWTVLNPLLNTLVMYLIFTHLLEQKDPYFILYLLCGNIMFSALRASTSQSLEASVRNRGLLLRTKIESYVFPTSYCLTSIVNFLFSLIAVLPFMLGLSIRMGVNLFTWRLTYILILIPALFLFELGIGLFLDCMFVFFRDIKHIYGVFLTLWMYVTPIFYKIDTMPDNVVSFIKLNPMFHFVTFFRDSIYLGAIGPTNPMWIRTLYVYGFGFLSMFIGVVTFKLLKKKIVTRI